MVAVWRRNQNSKGGKKRIWRGKDGEADDDEAAHFLSVFKRACALVALVAVHAKSELFKIMINQVESHPALNRNSGSGRRQHHDQMA